MSKLIAIMQPYIFPYIGYFQLVNYVDTFIFYDDVNYIKQGWINRNKLTINNKEHLFTVPLSNASSNKLIYQVEINKNAFFKVKKKLYKSIEQAYGKSVYFPEVYQIIKNTFDLNTNNISEMAQYSVTAISKYLELDTEFKSSKTSFNNNHLSGQDRVIDIARKEEAFSYINPIGGKDLYQSNYFRSNDIELSFIKVDDNLEQRLILDILMYHSKEEIKNILNKYNIIK